MALLLQIHDRTGNRKVGRVVHSRTGRKLTGLDLTWKTIREAVGIPDVRLHDLRHWFASDALGGGVSLALIGEILGHRRPSTTKRYAHLANRVVREALEHTAGIIVAATNTARALPVAPFEPLRDGQRAAIVTLVAPAQALHGVFPTIAARHARQHIWPGLDDLGAGRDVGLGGLEQIEAERLHLGGRRICGGVELPARALLLGDRPAVHQGPDRANTTP